MSLDESMPSPAADSAMAAPTAASNNIKRKRGGPVQTPLGDIYVDISPRKKKARFNVEATFDDAVSQVSDAQSYAESNLFTAADTETPITGPSSVKSKTKQREKKWVCTWPGCDKRYNRPIHLQTHMNSHTGERPYACEEQGCDKTFLKLEHLRRHTEDSHSDKVLVCEFETWNPESGRKEACGKTFSSKFKLSRHLAGHEEKAETTCSWEGCGQVFRKQETLQRHIRKDHLGEFEYSCTRKLANGEECGQQFEKVWQLKSHEAKEHNAPKYWCELCASAQPSYLDDLEPVIVNDLDPEFLPGPEDLENTKQEELDPGMLDTLSLNESPAKVAPTGAIGFVTYHELQRHITLAHPPTCSECGKECRSKKALTAHIEIEHGENTGVEPSKEKNFLCPYEGCARAQPGNGFTKKGHVPPHIKSAHIKAFVCGEFDLSGNAKVSGWNGKGCGQAMGTKQTLINHIRTKHMGLPGKEKKKGTTKSKRATSRKSQAEYDEEFMDDDEEDGDAEMDFDALPDSENPTLSRALCMLTGHGYNELRPFVCLVAHRGCQARFGKEYELAYHMEMTHEWNAEDINEALENVDNFAPLEDSERLLKEMLIKDAIAGAEHMSLDPQLA